LCPDRCGGGPETGRAPEPSGSRTKEEDVQTVESWREAEAEAFESKAAALERAVQALAVVEPFLGENDRASIRDTASRLRSAMSEYEDAAKIVRGGTRAVQHTIVTRREQVAL
jgi:hypothetical protein